MSNGKNLFEIKWGSNGPVLEIGSGFQTEINLTNGTTRFEAEAGPIDIGTDGRIQIDFGPIETDLNPDEDDKEKN